MMGFNFCMGFEWRRKTRHAQIRSRASRNLLLAIIVAIALLLLLLRMIAFGIAGHGHHRL